MGKTMKQSQKTRVPAGKWRGWCAVATLNSEGRPHCKYDVKEGDHSDSQRNSKDNQEEVWLFKGWARRPVRLGKKSKLDGNRRWGQRGKGMTKARRTCRWSKDAGSYWVKQESHCRVSAEQWHDLTHGLKGLCCIINHLKNAHQSYNETPCHNH